MSPRAIQIRKVDGAYNAVIQPACSGDDFDSFGSDVLQDCFDVCADCYPGVPVECLVGTPAQVSAMELRWARALLTHEYKQLIHWDGAHRGAMDFELRHMVPKFCNDLAGRGYRVAARLRDDYVNAFELYATT
jgi:hypothetical protein